MLHVHNYWFNLRDPEGPLWVAENLLTAPLSRDVEVGDRWFPYRGLPSMFLHVFRWRELAADLRRRAFASSSGSRWTPSAGTRSRGPGCSDRYAPTDGSSLARRDTVAALAELLPRAQPTECTAAIVRR